MAALMLMYHYKAHKTFSHHQQGMIDFNTTLSISPYPQGRKDFLIHSQAMSPRVGGEEKSGNIFTKFGEDFGESPNLVTNPVLIMSYI